jgi:hypothetical protein
MRAGCCLGLTAVLAALIMIQKEDWRRYTDIGVMAAESMRTRALAL